MLKRPGRQSCPLFVPCWDLLFEPFSELFPEILVLLPPPFPWAFVAALEIALAIAFAIAFHPPCAELLELEPVAAFALAEAGAAVAALVAAAGAAFALAEAVAAVDAAAVAEAFEDDALALDALSADPELVEETDFATDTEAATAAVAAEAAEAALLTEGAAPMLTPPRAETEAALPTDTPTVALGLLLGATPTSPRCTATVEL